MKENTKIFVETYNPPAIVLEMFEKCIDSPEHPIYHPEKTLDAHIEIVVQRALEHDALELHFAAFLHDICKHGFCEFMTPERQGTLKTIPEGTYFQNVKHPEQAVEFMSLLEVRNWIKRNGVDFYVVEKLVKHHMQMKNYIAGENGEEGGMGTSKRVTFKSNFSDYEWDLMCYFSEYCDNMSV